MAALAAAGATAVGIAMTADRARAAVSIAIASTATADRTRAAAKGSDRGHRMLPKLMRSRWNPAAFRIPGQPSRGRENSSAFAGHWGVALLNDAVSRRLFPDRFPGA